MTAERLNSSGHFAACTAYKVPFTAADFTDGSEVDLGEDLPDDGILLNAVMVVTTAEATAGTKTLSWGLLAGESGGDADGFDVAPSVAVIAEILGDGALVGTLLNGTAKSLSATFGDAGGANELAGYFIVYILHDSTKPGWNQL